MPELMQKPPQEHASSNYEKKAAETLKESGRKRWETLSADFRMGSSLVKTSEAGKALTGTNKVTNLLFGMNDGVYAQITYRDETNRGRIVHGVGILGDQAGQMTRDAMAYRGQNAVMDHVVFGGYQESGGIKLSFGSTGMRAETVIDVKVAVGMVKPPTIRELGKMKSEKIPIGGMVFVKGEGGMGGSLTRFYGKVVDYDPKGRYLDIAVIENSELTSKKQRISFDDVVSFHHY